MHSLTMLSSRIVTLSDLVNKNLESTALITALIIAFKKFVKGRGDLLHSLVHVDGNFVPKPLFYVNSTSVLVGVDDPITNPFCVPLCLAHRSH